MPKFDSKLFWKPILTIGLAVLGDSIMRELDLLQFGSPIVRAVYFVIALIVSGGVVQFSWMSIEKILTWNKSPKPKNINLSYLPLINNEIRLKVKNLEFRKSQVMVSKVEIGINGQRYLSSVIHNNTVLKFLKSVEVPFLKLIPTEGKFQVIYPESENQQEFGVGTYNFDVIVHYGYSTPREGLLSRYNVVVEFNNGVLKIVSLSTPAT